MMAERPDLCVIGAGSAGLTVAAGASQMGARVLLIESHKMGGDCLNYGCVPSKALLAAAHAAATVRRAAAFGVDGGGASIDFARAQAHVQAVIEAIRPQDSAERFRGLGVEVIFGRARFADPATVEVGERRIAARRFVVAAGSQPFVPPIPGLDKVPFFTNETVFDNRERPRHLIVIGGGPIGAELAQAHRRLDAEVSIVEMLTLLPKDDAELVAILRTALRRDGIALHEGAKVLAVERSPAGVAVEIEGAGGSRRLEGSHLLLAAGRRPNTAGLGLEAAGIEADRGGIKVDRRLRTSNRRVYAVGDIAGGPQFTHAAGYQAGIVLRNVLFRLPAKVDYRALPWVTFTEPELAQVGLTEAEARGRAGAITVLRWPYAENDRAQAERLTEGFVKALTDRQGRILGAGIVGAHAGELIQPWVLALQNRLKIGAMAAFVAPYPTLGEINKRAAGSYYAPKLFSECTRRLVRFLARFG
jgi:pyruvate/2-oxoglutarate dehydrogenase complex dihydrolipoamide dehydrogenase (E3) component